MSGPAKQPEPNLHIVLHQPEIPQNTGNIGRTCVALRAKLWLVRPLGFRLDEQRLRRAGLDYWEHLQWEAVADWTALTVGIGPDAGYWFFSKRGQRDFTTADFGRGDALVFGGETRGLPDELLREPQRVLRIPMHGPVRSLNLSNAVAVAGYECLRQTAL